MRVLILILSLASALGTGGLWYFEPEPYTFEAQLIGAGPYPIQVGRSGWLYVESPDAVSFRAEYGAELGQPIQYLDERGFRTMVPYVMKEPAGAVRILRTGAVVVFFELQGKRQYLPFLSSG